MSIEVGPNQVPIGYKAIPDEGQGCGECAFKGKPECNGVVCTTTTRTDKRSVIFKKLDTMDSDIDAYDAPVGFKAVKSEPSFECDGCFFWQGGKCKNSDSRRCVDRKDNRDVIFVKRNDGIDASDAPEGCVAIPCYEGQCDGCYFYKNHNCSSTTGSTKCTVNARSDCKSVIFKQLNDPTPEPTPEPAQSDGAMKFDLGKPRMELLERYAMEQTALVLNFGAVKYAPWNWTKGIAYSRLIGAALRHIFAFASGEDNDKESGLPHLAHAMCCIMFLLGMTQRHPELDDRNKVSAE